MRKISSAKKKVPPTKASASGSSSNYDDIRIKASPAAKILDAGRDDIGGTTKNARPKSSGVPVQAAQQRMPRAQTMEEEKQEQKMTHNFSGTATKQSSSPKRQARHQPKVVAGAANMFYNPDLEEKIANIQAEFQALLNSKGPQKMVVKDDGMTADAFYQEMDDFYHKGTKKHESPTRRLMD